MGKKLFNITLGAVLMLIAFGIMAFFPVRTSFLTWIIVAVSALAFCFGYFRLGIAFNGPMGKAFLIAKKLVFSLSGIAMIVFGVYSLIKEDFNGKGLGLFTMNLIYGLAMQYYAFNKAMNYAVDGIKQSDEVSASIEELYNVFKDIDTPMGRPWIGKVVNVEDDCIIYGPTDKGSFLFGYYLFGTFTFGASPLTKMLADPEAAGAHIVYTQWDRDDFGNGQLYHLLSRMLPDFYISMFENFSKTGRAACDFADLFESKIPNVYVFDEIFALMHQKYNLLDMQGNPRYYLHGVFPFWTFRLEDVRDGCEIVKSKRIIWHILFPTYDIYMNDEKYGRMRWMFRLLRTKFRMKTKDGEVVVREMTATIGDQFGVYRNGALIGTISQKIGLTSLGMFVRDMIFDNFVIMVFDDKDLPLVTTLSVMLGSFKNHGMKKE
ncbi:MAG: hypothetical protein IJT37_13560 [Lachnospiraceae bacterium]|nr:hypothetical protein [Lachnospiraceae bacterium]